MLHGGGPAGLVAWATEQLQAPRPMRPARLTVDLLRPAPLRPLGVRVQAVREGRQIQLGQIGLFDGETEAARAMALRVRVADLATPVTADDTLADPPPDACSLPGPVDRLWSPFLEGVEMRVARGSLQDSGPAAVWYRLQRPVVTGAPLSSASRAAVAADFANGTSAPLDPAAWSFVNSEITLQFERDPAGEWILVAHPPVSKATARAWP